MYFWAALLSFGAVAMSITGGTIEVLVIIGALLIVGIVVVLSPRARREAIAARQAELAALKERSRAAHPASRVTRGAPGGPVAPSGGTPPAAPVTASRTAGARR
jgi:UDP-GlcNAc:undecaprenyl-phosphate GlcNAc-1-phosphate transferase